MNKSSHAILAFVTSLRLTKDDLLQAAKNSVPSSNFDTEDCDAVKTPSDDLVENLNLGNKRALQLSWRGKVWVLVAQPYTSNNVQKVALQLISAKDGIALKLQKPFAIAEGKVEGDDGNVPAVPPPVDEVIPNRPMYPKGGDRGISKPVVRGLENLSGFPKLPRASASQRRHLTHPREACTT